MTHLIAAGEFYFDFVFYRLPNLPALGEELKTRHFALALGGGATTTALTAAKLGNRAELITALGQSALDAEAMRQLKQAKVETRHILRSKRYATGGLTVSVSTRKDRYFLTYLGANEVVEEHLLSLPVRRRLSQARHVHFGLSPRRWAPFCTLVEWLRKQGTTSSWDLGWNPETARDRGFQRLCQLLDIIFLNRDEALQYSGASTVRAALARLAHPGQSVVVKLGSEGAMAVGADGQRVRVKPLRVRAVDTTGAGDVFNGGFLHAWLQGTDLRRCLRVGNVCGALSTMTPGGPTGLPEQAQLARALRSAP